MRAHVTKVRSPVRRLARFYIHACKHWRKDRRAGAARNDSCLQKLAGMMFQGNVLIEICIQSTRSYGDFSKQLNSWVSSPTTQLFGHVINSFVLQ